ncbi:AAA family ATPase [Actinokineospora sp. HUAS TT18]|uniref:AAA family ATPase n=1 Tax=Actinokineospora sp. HUAS TT18 TaxID=3447451 RepID=UPI003F5229DD
MTGEIEKDDADYRRLVEQGGGYVTSADLDLAVDVAMAIGKPLLLYGEPGSGKSSLARYVAVSKGRRYYEHVTTARTGHQDLLWSFDHVRRLGDAQAERLTDDDRRYVSPGALWWAFERDSAVEVAAGREPFRRWNDEHAAARAVVLIDEIDKADPDTPNGLLVPLAGRRFTVADLGDKPVTDKLDDPTLIIITSNRERDLPQAFVRRCVVFRLPRHGGDTLREIAAGRLRSRGDELDDAMVTHLLDQLEKDRKQAQRANRRPPSTAEFLDAVDACVRLRIGTPDHDRLTQLMGMVFAKDAAGDRG